MISNRFFASLKIIMHSKVVFINFQSICCQIQIRDIEAMQIESYKQCISSLESEIKCRETERVSMEKQLNKLDQVIAQEHEKNNHMRADLERVDQKRMQLIEQLKRKDALISQKEQQTQQSNAQSSKLEAQVGDLQRQRDSLKKELQMKEQTFTFINSRLKANESELNTKNTLVDDLQKSLADSRTKIQAQSNSIRGLEERNSVLQTELHTLRQAYDSERNSLFLIKQESGNTTAVLEKKNQIIQDLEKTISNLQAQNRVHVQNQESVLQSANNQNSKFLERISQLESALKEQKEENQKILRVQQNREEVVSGLITEINFLKEEKMKFIQESEEKAAIKKSKSEKQVSALEVQVTELRNQNEFLKKKVAKKDKEIKGMAEELSEFNSDKERALREKTEKLEELLQEKSELTQRLKSLTSQSASEHESIFELRKSISSHEDAIESLNGMVEQLRKINEKLTKLLEVKTKEVETLEVSNQTLRKERVEFLKKEEEYRKKIIEFRNTFSSSVVRGANLRESSALSRNAKKMISMSMQGHTVNAEKRNSMLFSESARVDQQKHYYNQKLVDKNPYQCSEESSQQMMDFDFPQLPQNAKVESLRFGEGTPKTPGANGQVLMNASQDQMNFIKKKEKQNGNQNSGINLVTDVSEGAPQRLNGSMKGIDRLLDQFENGSIDG